MLLNADVVSQSAWSCLSFQYCYNPTWWQLCRELCPSRDRSEQQHKGAEREPGMSIKIQSLSSIHQCHRCHHWHYWRHYRHCHHCPQAVFTVVLLGFHLVGLILKCVYYRLVIINHPESLQVIMSHLRERLQKNLEMGGGFDKTANLVILGHCES